MTYADASRTSMDLSEAANVLKEIQLATTKSGYSKEFLQTLQNRYNLLSGLTDGFLSDDDRKRKNDAINANLTAAVVLRDHERFVSQGFKTSQDFFTFGKNLENDNYWNWLQENPEERKKVATNFVDGLYNEADELVEKGELRHDEVDAHVVKRKDEIKASSNNPERVEAMFDEGMDAKFNQVKGQSTEIENSQEKGNSEVKKFTSAVEVMVGKDLVADLAEKNVLKAASVAGGDEVATKGASIDRSASKEALRDAVVAKADDQKIDSKYAEVKKEFASIFEMPDAKVAASNLKESQSLVAETNKPASSPTEVANAQTDAGKAAGLSA